MLKRMQNAATQLLVPRISAAACAAGILAAALFGLAACTTKRPVARIRNETPHAMVVILAEPCVGPQRFGLPLAGRMAFRFVALPGSEWRESDPTVATDVRKFANLSTCYILGVRPQSPTLGGWQWYCATPDELRPNELLLKIEWAGDLPTVNAQGLESVQPSGDSFKSQIRMSRPLLA